MLVSDVQADIPADARQLCCWAAVCYARPHHAMADRRYLLLVNDALKTHLARLPAARRKQIREKLEFLENGVWDAGVRVKKLRGTPRVVFEARMSKGDRLLFTLGRHREAIAIYLW